VRSPRIAAVLLALAATLLAAPAPAWAHSRLLSTTPADAATVTAPVSEITLTFNESIHQRFSVVAVLGPGGAYGDGSLRVVDATVHQAVRPLKSGSYHVTWRVVSGDDHPIEGEFTFQVALPAELEPASESSKATQSASAPSSETAPATVDSSPPANQPSAAVPEQDLQGAWPYIALIVVVIVALAAAAVAIIQRRRGRP
jgi:methionine-rich copper-binding protein CopC